MFGTIYKLFSYSLLTSIIVLIMILMIKAIYFRDVVYSHRIRIADLLSISLLIFVTSARYGVGSDYYKYLRMSQSYANHFRTLDNLLRGEVIREYSYQIGFPAISIIANSLFHNEFAVFFVVACMIYIPFVLYFRKKSPNVFYSICVYILFGLWGLSLNVIKQAIAMVFICFAYEALKNRRFVLFALLTLLGTSFHSTALLAAIGLFVATFIKPTRRSLNICIVVGVVLRFVIMIIIRFLTRFALFARYYARYISGDTVSGVNRTVIPVGVLLETVFVLYVLNMAIKNKDELESIMPDIDSYISVIMVSIPFSILGISGSLWLANRFAKFYLLFLTILMPALMMQGKDLSRTRSYVIRVDRSFILLLMLFVWHFFYSSLILDNNAFIIDSLFFH